MSEGNRVDGQAPESQVSPEAEAARGHVAATVPAERKPAALPEAPRPAALPAETSVPARGEAQGQQAEAAGDARPSGAQGRRPAKARAKAEEAPEPAQTAPGDGSEGKVAPEGAAPAAAPADSGTDGEQRPERAPRRRARRQHPDARERTEEEPAAPAEPQGRTDGLVKADTAAPVEPAAAKPVEAAADAAGDPQRAAGEERPAAPARRERQARGSRQSAGSSKPVEEMSIEELLSQFSRRRRGRPSKKELQVREALAAAKANPTAELVDRARAAVIASMGGMSAKRVQRGPVAPVEQPADAEAQATAAPADAPASEPAADDAARQEASAHAEQSPSQEGGYGARRRRHEHRGASDQTERSAETRGEATQEQAGQKGSPSGREQRRERDFGQQRLRDGRQGQQRPRDGRGERDGRQAQGAGSQGQQFGKNGRRNGRDRRDAVVEPRTNRAELEELKVGDLRAKANELGIDPAGLKKPELIDAVYAAMVRQEGFFEFKGILDLAPEGFGFIRTKGYLASENDVYIAAGMVRSNGLRRGDEVAGIGRAGRPNDKYPAANKVLLVNGKTPDELRGRPRFGDLTPVFPSEPLKMEHGKDSILGRCIDLVAPIGKGQRGLIVSPPKAGKTTVLKKIAESIAANNPEVHLICLLVDERPEEVTDMQRSIRGEVVASTFDMPCDNHITVSELVVERAKRLVEQGEDVVILLDSITRLARAYNLAQPASGRILSGGVDSTALYPPKRFLGAARNIENGGSLTILASALVDTGSKMDEVIFEEFKGTGNMELKLDRDLADRRIFPAIDPIASGTRKEELLLDPSIAPFVWGIRRILAGMNSNERAMSSLIKSLKATSTNEEFLVRSAKKAQMQELNGDF